MENASDAFLDVVRKAMRPVAAERNVARASLGVAFSSSSVSVLPRLLSEAAMGALPPHRAKILGPA